MATSSMPESERNAAAEASGERRIESGRPTAPCREVGPHCGNTRQQGPGRRGCPNRALGSQALWSLSQLPERKPGAATRWRRAWSAGSAGDSPESPGPGTVAVSPLRKEVGEGGASH